MNDLHPDIPVCDICRLPVYDGMVNVSCVMCVANAGIRQTQSYNASFRYRRHLYHAERAVDEAFENRTH